MSEHEGVERSASQPASGQAGPSHALSRRARGAVSGPRPSARARAALPLDVVSEGMTARWVRVRPCDVVFVKGLVEASEGLAGVFAETGGDLLLAAPREREAELQELLADLLAELDAGLDAGLPGEAPASGQEP
jgi:hypothetical protein